MSDEFRSLGKVAQCLTCWDTTVNHVGHQHSLSPYALAALPVVERPVSDEYEPTMSDLRDAWVDMRADSIQEVPLAQAEYDRVLAAHDAEVSARALRDAAGYTYDEGATAWLNERADRIARGATR